MFVVWFQISWLIINLKENDTFFLPKGEEKSGCWVVSSGGNRCGRKSSGRSQETWSAVPGGALHTRPESQPPALGMWRKGSLMEE